MRYIILIALSIALIGCNHDALTLRLPPVGGIIYCPNADCIGYGGLYQRVEGTSRTAFKREDYVQVRFDVPVPAVGDEQICQLCHKTITYLDNGITYTHYRVPSIWGFAPAVAW